VPRMLEAAIAFQLGLGAYASAVVVAVLFVANASIGFVQERRAQSTLDALNKLLTLGASVRRERG
jgi:magnesium-transporting ATPase (P-type)